MFKVKDLMIKIVPGGGGRGGQGEGCQYCSGDCTEACTDACSPYITCRVCSDYDTHCGACTQGDTEAGCETTYDCCGWCTHGCSRTRDAAGRQQRPLGLEGLKALRAQLNARLQEVDREIEVRSELAKPRNVAEAEALEQKLAEALEEVRKIKSDLGKNS